MKIKNLLLTFFSLGFSFILFSPLVVNATVNYETLTSAPETCTYSGDTMPFTDISSSHWAYNYVKYGYSNGLFNGIVDGEIFNGTTYMTRTDAAVMMWNLAGNPEPEQAYQGNYLDVSAANYDNYTLNAIEWCRESGIMTGKTSTFFGATANIYRQDFAVIMYRYAKYIGINTDYGLSSLKQYDDALKVSGYAQEAVKWCAVFPYTYNDKMLAGTTATTLVPKSNINRFQATKIVSVMLKNQDYIESYTQEDKYIIEFNNNCKEISNLSQTMNSIVCCNGRSYTLPNNRFVYSGYMFTGWNTSSDGSGESYDNNSTYINTEALNGETVTLYAQWVKCCTVSYDSNYNSNTLKKEYVYMSQWTTENVLFTRENYTFTGWNTKADGTGTSYPVNTIQSEITEDIVLYAQWRSNIYTNSLKYSANGGLGAPSTQTTNVTYPNTQATFVVSASTPTKIGYTFKGWYTSASGGTKYEVGSSIIVGSANQTQNQTVTLYAQWTSGVVNKYNVKGCVDNIQSKSDGTVYVSGWAYDPDCSSSSIKVIVNVNGKEYTVQANKTSSDVNSAFGIYGYHRFDETISVTAKGLKNVSIYVYDYDSSVTQKTTKTTLKSKYVNISNVVHLIGHRGYSSIAPENTVASFTLAGKNGFWGCETDIWITKDGQFACMHDTYLSRTTGKSGVVKNYTLAQLQSTKITSGNNISSYNNQTVPSLQQYLTVCKQYGMVPIIEIKDGPYAGGTCLTVSQLRTLNSIVKSIMGDNLVYYIAFDLDNVTNMRTVLNECGDTTTILQYLTYSPNSCNFSQLASYNIGIDSEYTAVDSTTVANCKKYGLSLGIWTCDDVSKASSLTSLKVDNYITNVTSNVLLF